MNKGTAFTDAERREHSLEGLLPPAVTNIELQAARRHMEIANLGDDLQKYLVLSDLEHQAYRQLLARSSHRDIPRHMELNQIAG